MATSPRPPTPQDLAAARDVAVRFLDAVRAGDEPAARALLVLQEGESLDFRTMHASTAGYTLGPAEADGAHVVAVATITAAPGHDVPPALPIVLSRAGRGWNVDLGASMNRLLGVDLKQVMAQMAEGLGTALSQGLDAMGQALAGLDAGGAADGAAAADASGPARVEPSAPAPRRTGKARAAKDGPAKGRPPRRRGPA